MHKVFVSFSLHFWVVIIGFGIDMMPCIKVYWLVVHMLIYINPIYIFSLWFILNTTLWFANMCLWWRYCPRCKERRQASKKLDLWRLPEVLVIHLKRFSYSRSLKHKLETFVNFPIHDFNLTNYVANKSNTRHQLYELYALTNHFGGMGSGHYTAHIKVSSSLVNFLFGTFWLCLLFLMRN